MKNRVIIVAILLASALVSGGCSLFHGPLFWPRMKTAQKDFQARKYDSAVMKYSLLSDNHPEKQKKQFFLIQKGLALYILRSYHDAEKTFRNYILQYPDGDYRAEADAYLTKIEALRSEKERNYILEREQIKNDVKLLTQMVKRDPYNAQVHYDLANRMWELGDYNEAAEHYLKAGDIDAALKESELLRNRLMINEEGEVVPITPDRQQELERERNPLVIFDIHSYKQRIKPDYFGASKSFLTVAGKVRNQSNNVMRSVSVSVNFYNIHYEILDTQNYYIGTMGPGEVRAFLVKGQNYDNLYNIENFECVPFKR